MRQIAPREIADLETELERFHSTHAERYGPMETCKEETCVEVKQGIEWLQRQGGWDRRGGTEATA